MKRSFVVACRGDRFVICLARSFNTLVPQVVELKAAPGAGVARGGQEGRPRRPSPRDASRQMWLGEVEVPAALHHGWALGYTGELLLLGYQSLSSLLATAVCLRHCANAAPRRRVSSLEGPAAPKG